MRPAATAGLCCQETSHTPHTHSSCTTHGTRLTFLTSVAAPSMEIEKKGMEGGIERDRVESNLPPCNYAATALRTPPNHACVDSTTLAARSMAHNIQDTGFDLASDARPSARIHR